MFLLEADSVVITSEEPMGAGGNVVLLSYEGQYLNTTAVADLISIGAKHNIIAPPTVFERFSEDPRATAFLLVALQEYDGLYHESLLNSARKVIEDGATYAPLVGAALQLIGRQGTRSDLNLIDCTKFEAEGVRIQQMAARARMLIRHRSQLSP